MPRWRARLRRRWNRKTPANGRAGAATAATDRRDTRLADALRDVDAPGQLRKVGPSLRHLDSKVDYDWLYSWIRRPADFRPTTRMPQFFLHHEHLERRTQRISRSTMRPATKSKVTDREYTARFENIEIRALAEFLLDEQPAVRSTSSRRKASPKQPSAERGTVAVRIARLPGLPFAREFPGIASNQGPDLSRVAAKFNTEQGPALALQLAQAAEPLSRPHGDAELFLDPIAEVDASGNPTGR